MKVKPKKVQKVMKEYKSGTLHSGKGGPVVTSRKQAVAIALSEAGMAKKKAKTKPKKTTKKK
jgi:ribosomal protein L21E